LKENITYKYIEIPYIGKPSHTYAKKLRSIIKQNNPTTDLRVIYQPTNTTKRYFPTKDSLHINQKSGVIYQISCLNCTSTYIGKTIRQTSKRLYEHSKDVARATTYLTNPLSTAQSAKQPHQKTKKVINGRIEKKTLTQPLRRSSRLLEKLKQSKTQIPNYENNISDYKPNSALEKHVKYTGHAINFQDVQIINQDQKPYRLVIKESIAIRSKKPILNGTDTSVPLYVFPEGYQKSSYRRQ